MKTQILLLLSTLTFSNYLNAQQIEIIRKTKVDDIIKPNTNEFKLFSPRYAKSLKQKLLFQNKTTTNAERLIRINDVIGNTTRGELDFDYSSSRGGSLDQQMQYDNETYKSWDISSMSYLNSTRTSQTYDPNGNIASQSDFTYSGGTWQAGDKRVFSYRAGTQTVSGIATTTWNGSTYANKSNYAITFDGNGIPSSELNQVWVSSTYKNDWQSSCTNSSTNINNKIIQTWSSGSWTNSENWIYTYSGTDLQEVIEMQWSGSAWVNYQKVTFTETSTQEVVITYSWSGGAWSPVTKEIHDYNANDDFTDIIVQTPLSGGSWLDSKKWTFVYDPNNNLQNVTSNTNLFGVWTYTSNDESKDYYYEEYVLGKWQPTIVPNVLANSNNIKIFPNPASKELNLDLSKLNVNHVNIKIIGIKGNVLKTNDYDDIRSNIKIDISDIPQGIYNLLLNSQNNTYTNRFIVN